MAPATDSVPTLPPRDIPGLGYKKDYTAACPEQHLDWLKCIRDHYAFQINACSEQQERLSACVQAAKPEHLKAGRPSVMTETWQQFKQGPEYRDIADRVKALAAKLGISSSTDDKSDSAS